MYEIPPKRRAVRRAVTRADVEAAEAQATFTTRLIEAIETDPEVRAAVLRLVAGARRMSRPTTTTPIRRGGTR
ncbi:HD-like signal output (HDOD) protein [Streptomyces olivoverticillatus]|uniref:HD-like signal output (HDOD) protein n=1 Tax=Streptomyces olivoverticillatus TaxID=66427 RepID=A0A7W7PJV7_9ACTN|nr:HD-like signal output (HDOD) protein [Streptomyces olivoverticillatus]